MLLNFGEDILAIQLLRVSLRELMGFMKKTLHQPLMMRGEVSLEVGLVVVMNLSAVDCMENMRQVCMLYVRGDHRVSKRRMDKRSHALYIQTGKIAFAHPLMDKRPYLWQCHRCCEVS